MPVRPQLQVVADVAAGDPGQDLLRRDELHVGRGPRAPTRRPRAVSRRCGEQVTYATRPPGAAASSARFEQAALQRYEGVEVGGRPSPPRLRPTAQRAEPGARHVGEHPGERPRSPGRPGAVGDDHAPSVARSGGRPGAPSATRAARCRLSSTASSRLPSAPASPASSAGLAARVRRTGPASARPARPAGSAPRRPAAIPRPGRRPGPRRTAGRSPGCRTSRRRTATSGPGSRRPRRARPTSARPGRTASVGAGLSLSAASARLELVRRQQLGEGVDDPARVGVPDGQRGDRPQAPRLSSATQSS